MLKRQELEKIKSEQDRILEEERKAREGLEELSKEQQKALDDVRCYTFLKTILGVKIIFDDLIGV